MAKEEWRKVTGVPFPTHSNIRWYSKYDTLETISQYFPDMLTVMTNIANKGLSSKNTPKLLKMLLDETQVWYLKIELASYVEALFDLRNLCYFLEGDGTDMPFKVGERLGRISKLWPNGEMKRLRSTEALIKKVSIVPSCGNLYLFVCLFVMRCAIRPAPPLEFVWVGTSMFWLFYSYCYSIHIHLTNHFHFVHVLLGYPVGCE